MYNFVDGPVAYEGAVGQVAHLVRPHALARRVVARLVAGEHGVRAKAQGAGCACWAKCGGRTGAKYTKAVGKIPPGPRAMGLGPGAA